MIVVVAVKTILAAKIARVAMKNAVVDRGTKTLYNKIFLQPL
jgi:hypothetical protein